MSQFNNMDATNLVPPHNPDAERSVLGSCLRDNGVIGDVTRIVQAKSFYTDAHQKIFVGIVALHDKGEPVDLVTLAEHLKQKNQVEDIGGYPYLGELRDAAPTSANSEYYAAIVKRDSQLRQTIQAANELLRNAWDGTGPPDELIEQHQQALADIATSDRATARHRFQWRPLDCGSLARADFRPRWLVKRLLVAGQPAVVGGARKMLKTSIEVDLAVSLASGTPFLGEFAVYNPVRVAMLSGESGDFTMQETALRIAESRGLNLSALDRDLLFQFDLPQFGNAEHLKALRTGIERDKIEVLIVDPLYLCLLTGHGDDRPRPESLFDMGPLLLGITQTCLSAGCTPVFSHHALKHTAKSNEPLELDDLAFAGIAEFARQWLLVSRREKYEPGTGQHKLWLNVGGSVGHGGLWSVDVDEGHIDESFKGRTWDVTVTTATEARAAVKDDKEVAKQRKASEQDRLDDKAMLAALDKLDADGIGAGYNRVQNECRLSNARMERSFNRLKNENIVKEVQVAVGIGSNTKRTVKGMCRVSPVRSTIPFPA